MGSIPKPAVVSGQNFSVVGGLERPEHPLENTIWIKTDVPITSHIIGKNTAGIYTVSEGPVFIQTGDTGSIRIDALKGSTTLFFYPTGFAQQSVKRSPTMAAASWTTKEMMIYQYGTWQTVKEE